MRKSDGVRAHDEKERWVRFGHKKELWGESSP